MEFKIFVPRHSYKLQLIPTLDSSNPFEILDSSKVSEDIDEHFAKVCKKQRVTVRIQNNVELKIALKKFVEY